MQAEIDIFKQISVPFHVEWIIDAKNTCNFSIQLCESKYYSFRNLFRTENFPQVSSVKWLYKTVKKKKEHVKQWNANMYMYMYV
jgi:hypothetical protein